MCVDLLCVVIYLESSRLTHVVHPFLYPDRIPEFLVVSADPFYCDALVTLWLSV